eukprot:12675658-Alexandrium_andersonii.AAC.1
MLCPAVSGCARRPAGAFGSVRELCPYAASGVLCPAVRRRDAKCTGWNSRIARREGIHISARAVVFG